MSRQQKCCGWTRPCENALEAEKKIYNTCLFSSDTMYCHHLADDGRHCVLNNLDSSHARKCPGIMYVNFDWGLTLVCDCQRSDYEHSKCTKERCPYMKEKGSCPYMKG